MNNGNSANNKAKIKMLHAETDSTQAPSGDSDALFKHLVELGFEKRSRFGAVIWEGFYQGRATTLTISRQSRARHQGQIRWRQHLGWRLRIEMGCQVMTRLFFVTGGFTNWPIIRWIYRLKKQHVIEDLPTLLDGFQVVARDKTWALDLLRDKATTLRVASLLTERSTERLRGSIYFQPGQIHYGSGLLQPEDIDTHWVDSVLQRTAQIAASAESLPPPGVQDRPTRLERLGRERPLLVGGLILSALLAGLLGVFALGMGMLLALGWALSSV